ncbi:MAG: energy transducer TonB [Bacteroidales bacterium]|nr:energy transducer TonB [Bacteroidales bacterium]
MRKTALLIITLLLGGSVAMAQNNGTATVGGEIYTVVEQSPEFPGGEDALIQWLGTHVQYPTAAKEKGVEGAIFVTFVVEKDGSISDVKVINSKPETAALEQEAVRVVRAMPKWKAGKSRGKKVRVQFNLPIVFKLQ